MCIRWIKHTPGCDILKAICPQTQLHICNRIPSLILFALNDKREMEKWQKCQPSYFAKVGLFTNKHPGIFISQQIITQLDKYSCNSPFFTPTFRI